MFSNHGLLIFKNPLFAGMANNMLQKLHKIESYAREENLSADQVTALRQEKSRPVL